MGERIERLTLRGFRGASRPVEFTFDSHAPITLIFGENGTGKSTVCDAIDFICNARFGSLQEKSASMRASDAVVALGAAAGELEVHLHASGGAWTGKLRGTKADIKGPDDRPTAHILRRVDITRVVEAAPKEKYEALKLFITAPRIEKAEKALRDAINIVKKRIEEAGRAKAQADSALETLWQLAGAPAGSTASGWAEGVAAQDVGAVGRRIAESQKRMDALANAARLAKSATDARTAREAAAAQLREFDAQLSHAQDSAAHRDARLVRLLREAKSFLDGAVTDACPMCGRPATAAHLREHIDAHLAELTAQLDLQTRHDQATARLSSAQAVLEAAEKAVLAATGAPMLDTALAQAANAETERAALQHEVDDEQRAVAQHSAVRAHLEVIRTRAAPLAAGFETQIRLEQMLEVVESRRKAYVDGLLQDISATVDDLYSRIHPREDLGEVKFYLKPNTIGSLEFDARFQSQRAVSPASYYSEAHLDTLGLCVYLALAKQMRQDAVVVLDDVLTSIDDAHLGRVIQLLHDEAANFNQVIITTHFRAWRDRYRFFHAPSQQVQLIQLNRWSLDRGITHSRDQAGVDELRDWVNREPFERQIVASKAGILLEGMLDHLAQIYRCRLPRKPDNDYSLVELARSFEIKLKRVLLIQRDGVSIALEPFLTRIDGTAWIRNQVGAHHNMAAAGVPDDDVRAFAQLTLDFANVVVCPHCGQLPARTRSGSYYECQCGKTQLHPLVTPG
jgi:AAA domain